jgi:hypothetical protein
MTDIGTYHMGCSLTMDLSVMTAKATQAKQRHSRWVYLSWRSFMVLSPITHYLAIVLCPPSSVIRYPSSVLCPLSSVICVYPSLRFRAMFSEQ